MTEQTAPCARETALDGPEAPEAAPDAVLDVFAWRRGRQWLYSLVEKCAWCGKRHYHGGGRGDQPDLKIGESGNWVTHCLSPDHPGGEECTLRYIDEGWRP